LLSTRGLINHLFSKLYQHPLGFISFSPALSPITRAAVKARDAIRTTYQCRPSYTFRGPELPHSLQLIVPQSPECFVQKPSTEQLQTSHSWIRALVSLCPLFLYLKCTNRSVHRIYITRGFNNANVSVGF